MDDSMDQALKERLSRSEDQWVERKESLSNAGDIRKTLVAFANSVKEGEEAILFIGVSNSGELKGLSDPDSDQKTIDRLAKTQCYPPIDYRARVLDCETTSGRVRILAVVIPFGCRRPHFGGVAHVRRGSQSIEASEEMFKELISSQNDTARRLLQFKGQKVLLRWQSVSGLFFDCEVIIQACDAHSVQVKDNWGHIWELPVPKIHFTNDSFHKIKIVAPTQWTEPQQIQKMLRMIYQFLPDTGPVHLKRDDYLLAQLLAFPQLALPVVSSEMDGTTHQVLKHIRVLITFEMKKSSQPRTHAQKQREVQQRYKALVAQADFPSDTVVLSAATSAIVEISTSLEETEEFLALLFEHNPELWHVMRHTVRAAVAWQLGLA